MSPVLEEAEENGVAVNAAMKTTSMIILATDGTSQSEQAVRLARFVSARTKSDIKVLTVVDQPPIPWGTLGSASAADYERGLSAEALATVNQQILSFGDSKWPVEVEVGDSAETIATTAKASDAKLIIVGLGGHGAISRVFGSETALRIARVSEIPMLAVEPRLTHLPKRILVAMDFSEASIEVARLALELADEASSMVLVNVVPWKRTPYVPDEWVRTHEASVSAQLSRIVGWLNRDRGFRIEQRILYGQPGVTLLEYAEEMDVDLIATGTHGRTAAKRLLGGQTVDKLIRGARCSILVFPAAAAFHERLAHPEISLKGDQYAG